MVIFGRERIVVIAGFMVGFGIGVMLPPHSLSHPHMFEETRQKKLVAAEKIRVSAEDHSWCSCSKEEEKSKK